MHRIALQRRDEGADILHTDGIEPAPFYAAPDREQVCLGLVRTFELVAAFMGIDVELHCSGEPGDLLGVEDEEAREGAAPTVEIGVEHRRPLAAIDLPAVKLQLALGNELGVGTGLLQIVVDGRAARSVQESVLLGASRQRLDRKASADQDAEKRPPNSHWRIPHKTQLTGRTGFAQSACKCPKSAAICRR